MGAGGAGASGSDAGFQNSLETRNKKANDAAAKRGTSDYQGDLDPKGRSNNNNNVDNTGKGGEGTNILIAPTVAEVSQSQAANATTAVDEKDPLYLRKKKTQAKGRSATILTSSKGVDEDSTLGKKSLLGA